jgi:hypothetical protein
MCFERTNAALDTVVVHRVSIVGLLESPRARGDVGISHSACKI